MITGGASGIGAATVERFLEEGARVAVIDCDEVGSQNLRKKHPNLAGVIIADVANADAVEVAFREVDELLGGVDVTINNAGISLPHDFMDITPAEWRKVMSIDLDGVFYVAQQSAKRMLAGNGGVIINMGSTSGMNGYPRYADYNAAKAGVIELTRTMALELAPTIRVIAVCPGYVWTAMQEAEYTPEMKAAVDAKNSAAPPCETKRNRRTLCVPCFRRSSIYNGSSRHHRWWRNRRRSREPLNTHASVVCHQMKSSK